MTHTGLIHTGDKGAHTLPFTISGAGARTRRGGERRRYKYNHYAHDHVVIIIEPIRCRLAFTRYSFTSKLLCKSESSFHWPSPSALPTLVQDYCTTIGQYTTPPPTSRLYAIHHTIMVIKISCKGQRCRGYGTVSDADTPFPRVNPSTSASLDYEVRRVHYREFEVKSLERTGHLEPALVSTVKSAGVCARQVRGGRQC